jgi:integral membrane sensor domain MASE1
VSVRIDRRAYLLTIWAAVKEKESLSGDPAQEHGKDDMTPFRARHLTVVTLLAIVYFTMGKLGLMLAFVHVSATAVWPPAGIALAALLLLGYRVWPGIFFGAFLVNMTTAGTVLTTLGIATGNTLEGVMGAYLINRFANGRRVFDRPDDVFLFTVLAGLASTTIGATLGATSLALGNFANWANYGSIWVTWWLGDAAGDLLVAPLLVLWSENPRLRWHAGQIIEAAFMLMCSVLVGLVVFGGLLHTDVKTYPLDYLCLPILVWAAIRFGRRVAATVSLLLSGIAIWGTLQGFGPFVPGTPNESLLLLQVFMSVTAVMALALAGVISQRKRAEEDRGRLILELQDALEDVKILRGLLPICASCKKIRDDEGGWNHIENYIQKHSEAQFTHGICPECLERLYPEARKGKK